MKRLVKRHAKKFLAGILAAALLAAGIAPCPADAAQEAKTAQNRLADTADETLLAHYDFETAAGSVIADASQNGYDGMLKGTGGKVSGGELVLPGGASGSGAAYVELPAGMFDGRDALTISLWLKNETPRGNYCAMYFGTESTSHYWLMNPQTAGGTFKSVITKNSYNGEYGFSPTNGANGLEGPISSNQYAMYTTVLEPGKMTLYYNGKCCGTVNTGISVSDLGSGLSAYIGKSPYPDVFLKGAIREIKVYETAKKEQEIVDAYYSEVEDREIPKAALQEDKRALEIGVSETVSDLALPMRGQNGSALTWRTSNDRYLRPDGSVTRPDAQTGDVTVTLTAQLSLGGQTDTKAFAVKVLAATPENDVKAALAKFELGQSVATEDIVLPGSLDGGVSLAWKSSDTSLISDSGKITRPAAGSGNASAVLTATASLQGKSRTKEFSVEVVEQPYGRILTYVREGNTQRTDALHYACSIDGAQYTALNNNRPILYWNELLDKKMGSPSLFRKADGSYGMIASDDNNGAEVIVYDSADLLTFTNPRKLSFGQQGIKVADPTCRYDSASGEYKISYRGSDGKSYEAGTKDFQTVDGVAPSDYEREGVTGGLPDGAIEADVFEATKAEYESVLNKWQRVVNTNVSAFGAVEVEKNAPFSEQQLPERATANYSDGSTKQFPVLWEEKELAQVDTGKPGSYTVHGTLCQPEYSDVLVEQRADPWTFLGDDGYYYFTGSYPVCGTKEEEQKIGYDRIALRRSKTLQGLKDAEEVDIWHAGENGTYRYVWAPEIHQIEGKWYVFFTVSLSRSNPYDIRPHVLECSGGDPMNPSNWTLHRMTAAEGDSFALGQFSLDMTHFESDGVHYVVWAAKPGSGYFSNLYIATVDPARPWQLTSRSTEVTVPDFAWENPINEGPAVIMHDGMVYLCYSAAAVNFTYCVGMLSAKEGDDLLDASVWTKYPIPLLSTDDLVNQCGPGHNSFTVDENGNPVIVYHARPVLECSSGGDWSGTVGRCEYINPGENSLIDPCRHARVKAVNFAADGTPILNMTPEEELKSENRQVQVTVSVKEKDQDKDPGNTRPVTPPQEQKKAVKSVELSGKKYVYNGKTRTPKVVVKDTDGHIVSSDDYQVKYAKGRKQPGSYPVTVTMRNGYTGTYTKSFRIHPKKVKVKKASAVKKGIKLSWKKAAESITGYEIQYSSSAKFQKKRTVSKLLKKGKTSYQIKKLKPKKKYYVRVRAYKKAAENKKSVNLYSDWSKKKALRIK